MSNLMNTYPVLVDSSGNHDLDGELTLCLYRNVTDAQFNSDEKSMPFQIPNDELPATVESLTLIQMVYFLMETNQIDSFKNWVNKRSEDGSNLPCNSGPIAEVIEENKESSFLFKEDFNDDEENDFDVDLDTDYVYPYDETFNE